MALRAQSTKNDRAREDLRGQIVAYRDEVEMKIQKADKFNGLISEENSNLNSVIQEKDQIINE